MAVTLETNLLTVGSCTFPEPLPYSPLRFCRAWVFFNGTGTTGAAQSIYSSGNVSSVVKTATGMFTINFATAMADANYAGMGSSGTGAGLLRIVGVYRNSAPTSSSVSIETYDVGGTSQNVVYTSFAAFR